MATKSSVSRTECAEKSLYKIYLLSLAESHLCQRSCKRNSRCSRKRFSSTEHMHSVMNSVVNNHFTMLINFRHGFTQRNYIASVLHFIILLSTFSIGHSWLCDTWLCYSVADKVSVIPLRLLRTSRPAAFMSAQRGSSSVSVMCIWILGSRCQVLLTASDQCAIWLHAAQHTNAWACAIWFPWFQWEMIAHAVDA